MLDILIAVSILLAVGAVAAVLLAVAAHYMGIKEDEKISEIRDCLPGANCGACGFTGCDGYAEAVVAGKCEAHLCIPGGQSVASDIAKTLGVEVANVASYVAFVHCNGTCSATERRADYDGYRTCAAMNLVAGGPGSCKFGCLGCGDCAESCPVGAICIDDGIARVLSDRCIGCGKCKSACPKNIISMIPKDSSVAVACSSRNKGIDTKKNCKVGCIGCGKCQKVCPESAITVKDNLAVIDYEKCISCGACFDACPIKCIASFSAVNQNEEEIT